MAAAQTPAFIEKRYVQDRVWDVEGAKITDRLIQLKKEMGDKLLQVVLYPNVSFSDYASGEVLNGAVYVIRKGTPVSMFVKHMGPLYQSFSAFGLGNISESQINSKKAEWMEIINAPSNDKKLDLISAFTARNSEPVPAWNTSLGTTYSSIGGIYKGKDNAMLILSGGHEQVHRNLLQTIISKPDLKVEDLIEMKTVMLKEGSLSETIKAVKNIQKVNHSAIASKVKNLFKGGQVNTGPQTDFKADEKPCYSAFYNTIREVVGKNEIVAITQGVVDMVKDVEDFGGSADLSAFMIESPLRLREFKFKKSFLNHVPYFPISTGSSFKTDFGMSSDDKKNIVQNISWTGSLGIHNVALMGYQPYDTIMKKATNVLFGGEGFAAITAENSYEGVLYTINGIESSDLKIENYLDYTNHLSEDDLVAIPVLSPPSDAIIKTFPRVLDALQAEGLQGCELPIVMKTHPKNNHYVTVPVGSIRHAHHLSMQPHEEDVLKSYQGLPK